MKKIKFTVVGILFLVLLTIVVTPPMGVSSSQNTHPRIRIDGEFVYIPANEQQPIILDGRTLVPFRAVMEALGFRVEWNSSQELAIFTTPRHAVFIRIGASTMQVNGDTIALDVPAQIMNGRTMIPMRAIGEAVGVEFRWDNINRIVEISTHGIFRPEPVLRPAYWPEHLPEHIPGSVTLRSEDFFVGVVDLSEPMQFRALFYYVDGDFMDLVATPGRTPVDWSSVPVTGSPGPTMFLMEYIRQHGISREEFDAVVANSREGIERLAARGIIDSDCEMHELPNADIIFTFDNDIIRYFYRRE